MPDPVTGTAATGVYMAATTMTLTGIVMAQVGNGFAMRTHRQSILAVGFFSNKMRLWGIGGEILGVAALMYIPVFQKVFSTAPLTWQEWGVLALCSPIAAHRGRDPQVHTQELVEAGRSGAGSQARARHDVKAR